MIKKQRLTIRNVQDYLTKLEQCQIDPNFFTSLAYLYLSKVQVYSFQDWMWMEDDEWIVLPPVSDKVNNKALSWNKPIWAGFLNHSIEGFKIGSFLDWQFTFDPIHFNELGGKDWKVYRKNIRKYPTRNGSWEYVNTPLNNEALDLVNQWVGEKINDILDVELLYSYALEDHTKIGVHKHYLYDKSQHLIAINIWDENYRYINFRYCIVRPDIPFLDEFARYLFYTHPEIQQQGKLVNDGGSLGNVGLERFKDKMNPFKKQQIYSLNPNKL